MNDSKKKYSFLVTDQIKSSYGIRGLCAQTDNSYIPRCIEQVLGKGNEVFFKSNISAAFEILKEKHPSGLIIPHGHGDYNTLAHFLALNKGELSIPVCELYKVEEGVEQALINWLTKNFQTRA